MAVCLVHQAAEAVLNTALLHYYLSHYLLLPEEDTDGQEIFAGKMEKYCEGTGKIFFISLRLFEIKINYFSFISVVCVRGSTLPLPPGEVCWQLGFHFLYDVTFTHF